MKNAGHIRSFLRVLYLILTLIFIFLTYYHLGIVRSEFFKISILQNKIVEVENQIRENPMDLSLIQKKIALEISIAKARDLLLTSDNYKNILKRIFFLCTLCFALIAGVLFSDGFKIIKVQCQQYRIKKEMRRITETHDEVNLIFKYFVENKHTSGQERYTAATSLPEQLAKRYKHLYLHGYWRGFLEENPSLSSLHQKILYKTVLMKGRSLDDPPIDDSSKTGG